MKNRQIWEDFLFALQLLECCQTNNFLNLKQMIKCKTGAPKKLFEIST